VILPKVGISLEHVVKSDGLQRGPPCSAGSPSMLFAQLGTPACLTACVCLTFCLDLMLLGYTCVDLYFTRCCAVTACNLLDARLLEWESMEGVSMHNASSLEARSRRSALGISKAKLQPTPACHTNHITIMITLTIAFTSYR